MKIFISVIMLLMSLGITAHALPTLTEPNAAATCDDSSTPSCENITAGEPALCNNGAPASCRIWRWQHYVTTSSICINGAALCSRYAAD